MFEVVLKWLFDGICGGTWWARWKPHFARCFVVGRLPRSQPWIKLEPSQVPEVQPMAGEITSRKKIQWTYKLNVSVAHITCVSRTHGHIYIYLYTYIYMHMHAQYDYVYVLHLSIYLSIHPSTHLSIYVHIHENKMWECDCPIISRCLYIIPQFNIMGCPWMP
jgi:hypothetical protein